MVQRALRVTVVAVGLTAMAACGSGGSKASSATTRATTSTSAGATSTSAAAVACPSRTTVSGSSSGPETNPPGDIPDNQAFVPYSPADNRYTVKVPEGWARTETAGGASFTDKLNRIDIEVVAMAAAPTVDTAKASDVPKLEQSTDCFALKAVTTVTRRAGVAVLVTYQADSAPDTVTGKTVRDDVERYELWKSGTAVVLTLSGPAGSDNVDPWKIVTDSFAWR